VLYLVLCQVMEFKCLVLCLVSGVGICVFGVVFDLMFGVLFSVGRRNLNVRCWV